MPQIRRNSGSARKKEKFDLELYHIVAFLRFIAAMTGTLLLISLVLFFLVETTEAGKAVYIITILVNFVAFFGSVFGAWRLNKKDEELSREKENQFRS